MISEIDKILDPNETIIWRGRPKLVAYLFKTVPVVFFGLFWCMFLVPFYWMVFTKKAPVFVWIILGPHTLVGLGMLTAPLWAGLIYPYIEYAITNRHVILKSGLFARDFSTVDFVYLTDVSVSVGLIGRITNTGDINFVSGMGIFTPKTGRSALCAVENPYDVFKLLKQAYFDVKTDVEFPNKLRPPVNPGYPSEYHPFGPS